MKKVLVTGGAGFIGSHLCERLLGAGMEVICLDNFNDSYDPAYKRNNVKKALELPGYTLIEGDIRDERLLSDLFAGSEPDTVIHLAALAGVRRSISNPLEYVDVDIGGTVSILEACRKNRVGKLVFASSSSVYGLNPAPFRETDILRSQTSPYAAAKYSGEVYSKLYSETYGLPVAALRFFTVYGPRQRPDMAIHKFTAALQQGSPITVYGDGRSMRDYTYIDDIVDGIVASALYDCSFEVFNLGNSKPERLMDMIACIEDAAGIRARLEYLPEQPGDVPATCADIGKASALLGYSPKTGLKTGIERFVEWYFDH